MPDTPKFVVNDRRKFTAEGEPRHDAPTPAAGSADGPQLGGPQLVEAAGNAELADIPESAAIGDLNTANYIENAGSLQDSPADTQQDAGQYPDPDAAFDEGVLPPGPTDEQNAEATRAYEATVDRLDTALRAADPGGERMPEMSFERLTQSLYTQALLLLGGGAQPGETPRVDILGARQTIDMIAIIAEKTKGNLSSDEDKLLQSALFDLRMGFLEITQALARQAAQRQPGGPGGPGGFGGTAPGAGPRIVR